jgi:hypothetical protein
MHRVLSSTSLCYVYLSGPYTPILIADTSPALVTNSMMLPINKGMFAAYWSTSTEILRAQIPFRQYTLDNHVARTWATCTHIYIYFKEQKLY